VTVKTNIWNYLLCLDILLSNILLQLPSSFDQLSIEQLYEKYGKPETGTVTPRNQGSLTANFPPKAVVPLHLGKERKNTHFLKWVQQASFLVTLGRHLSQHPTFDMAKIVTLRSLFRALRHILNRKHHCHIHQISGASLQQYGIFPG
jgi:hypothetical protein